METSKILSNEHKNILKVIESLGEEVDGLESDKKIDSKFFTKVIEFIRNYADKFHHAKEEDILFKEFCKEEENLHCNPVEQMLHEHELGRNFVKEMEEGVEESDKKKVIENATGYSSLLQEHIFKEDNILYPMADEALSPQVQKEMLKKFKQIEGEKKKDKEKYEKFAKGLK